MRHSSCGHMLTAACALSGAWRIGVEHAVWGDEVHQRRARCACMAAPGTRTKLTQSETPTPPHPTPFRPTIGACDIDTVWIELSPRQPRGGS